MKNKDLFSALVGSTFFAIPYLGLGVTMLPSLVIGGMAFTAGELVFSSIKSKTTLKETNFNLYKKVLEAKKGKKEIDALIPKVEKEFTKTNLKEISKTIEKILNVVENDSSKEKKLHNFFDYYLPVLIKLVNKYDEIENQNLVSKEGKEFLKKADKIIEETNKAFSYILASLYQKDLLDIEAEMKVYDMMLKSDGIEESSFMKGREDDE